MPVLTSSSGRLARCSLGARTACQFKFAFSRHLCSVGITGKLSKSDVRSLQFERMKNAFNGGQRIALDFGLHGNNMTEKDIRRLVQQTKLLYHVNMNATKPFALTFAELHRNSTIYSQFQKDFVNFVDIVAEISEKPIFNIFDQPDVIYLTPDSSEALQELDVKKVYVLGGLVDYQVKKNMTLHKAMSFGIETRRLPIPEFMDKKTEKGRNYGYSKILSINQVFDILLKYQETEDWRIALSVGIPARKGYEPKPR